MKDNEIKTLERVIRTVFDMPDSKVRLALIGILIDIDKYRPCLCISGERDACPYYFECPENVSCMETWLCNAMQMEVKNDD
jgi:hypothetical protein